MVFVSAPKSPCGCRNHHVGAEPACALSSSALPRILRCRCCAGDVWTGPRPHHPCRVRDRPHPGAPLGSLRFPSTPHHTGRPTAHCTARALTFALSADTPSGSLSHRSRPLAPLPFQRGAIVLFDEGHNVPDAAREAATLGLDAKGLLTLPPQLARARNALAKRPRRDETAERLRVTARAACDEAARRAGGPFSRTDLP